MDYRQARRFLYRNARPLDLARWNFHFENGSRGAVLDALAAYQNEDGGFGGALEPDCWNPHSSPVQTWTAAEILREIGFTDKTHPLVRGILRYLAGGDAFDGHTWANCVPSNNDFPHAPWWQYTPDAPLSYNPTASLAGFLLRFADAGSLLHGCGCLLAQEAFCWFEANAPLESFHTAACFLELYEDLKLSGAAVPVDSAAFRALLARQLAASVTADAAAWENAYVCKPSLFLHSRESEFYPLLCEAAAQECRFLDDTQAPDGSWALTWQWSDYPEQWAVSKNWWKGDQIVKNALFLSAMRG